MQDMYEAAGTTVQNTANASNTIVLVAAAANVNGHIIKQVTFRWIFTAINGGIQLSINGAGGSRRAHQAQDTNGAAGPINIPQFQVSDKEIFLPGGADINLTFILTNCLLNYSVLLKNM